MYQVSLFSYVTFYPLEQEHQMRIEKCQPASNDNDNTMAWEDPMELEYQVTNPKDQQHVSISNDESSHVMDSYQRSCCWWQFWLCALITSLVFLCCSSSSLAAPWFFSQDSPFSQSKCATANQSKCATAIPGELLTSFDLIAYLVVWFIFRTWSFGNSLKITALFQCLACKL